MISIAECVLFVAPSADFIPCVWLKAPGNVGPFGEGKFGWGGRIRKLVACRAKHSKIVAIQCFQQFTLALA
jgi:hypothetical protein